MRITQDAIHQARKDIDDAEVEFEQKLRSLSNTIETSNLRGQVKEALQKKFEEKEADFNQLKKEVNEAGAYMEDKETGFVNLMDEVKADMK